ncbi:MAG: FixH family protein [Chloroflexi bacterium OHK40]
MAYRLLSISRRLFVVAWLLVLAGCAAQLPSLAANEVRAQQTVDGITVTLDSGRAPRVNETQHFRVTLTDERGRPIDGADVYLELEMDMICLGGGMPVAEAVGPGQYALNAVYPMPGDWEVTVHATIASHTYQATFAIPVAEGAG